MPTKEKDILKILDAIARYDIHDNLWWRTEGEYAPITFFVNCNDLFYWATGDLEELTLDNLSVLEQAIADCMEVDPVLADIRGCDLFCCRIRGMRPQQPAYPKDSFYSTAERWKPLFDACGPERNEQWR